MAITPQASHTSKAKTVTSNKAKTVTPTAPQPLFKLGKRVPRFDPRTLQFGAYLTKNLAAPPASVDYTTKVKAWPMMGNDKYGDCTCAAAGHMIEEWTANAARRATILPLGDILKAYKHFAGNNPDAGANMLDVLNYWEKTGIGGDKIHAFTQLQPRSDPQVRDAVYYFGNCYIGVALPNFAVKPGTDFLKTPWVVPPQGLVGDAAPNPDNGHCIPAMGYDQRNLYVITWGAVKLMSWEFYDAYMDEAYAVLSTDWTTKNKAPNGFDLNALEQDLAAIPHSSAARGD